MSWLKNLLQKNLGAKIIAGLAAIILWVYVMNEQNPFMENSFSVPVVVENAPDNCLIKCPTEKIKIRIRGKRSAFLAAPRSELVAKLDLEGLNEGTHKIEPEVKLPPGLELMNISLKEIELSIDRVIKKNVPISVVTTDNVADGKAVTRIVPEVVVMEVSGARREVEKVRKVIASVPLAGSNSSFKIMVPLSPVDEKNVPVADVKLDKTQLSVHVEISRGIVRKTVNIKPVFSGELPEGYSVSGTHIVPEHVTIEGSPEHVAQINEVETVPLSLAGATRNIKRTVRLRSPGGVTVPDIEATVDVDITGKE